MRNMYKKVLNSKWHLLANQWVKLILCFFFSIDIANLSHGNGMLRCKKFKRKSFLKFFGLESDELLPLCAAILGNDETMGKTQLSSVIDRIFAQVKREKLRKSSCKR